MQLKIRWIKDGPHGDQESMEGRFSIESFCCGRETPMYYNLRDRVIGQTYNDMTITECKQKALQIAIGDISKHTGRILA